MYSLTSIPNNHIYNMVTSDITQKFGLSFENLSAIYKDENDNRLLSKNDFSLTDKIICYMANLNEYFFEFEYNHDMDVNSLILLTIMLLEEYHKNKDSKEKYYSVYLKDIYDKIKEYFLNVDGTNSNSRFITAITEFIRENVSTKLKLIFSSDELKNKATDSYVINYLNKLQENFENYDLSEVKIIRFIEEEINSDFLLMEKKFEEEKEEIDTEIINEEDTEDLNLSFLKDLQKLIDMYIKKIERRK